MASMAAKARAELASAYRTDGEHQQREADGEFVDCECGYYSHEATAYDAIIADGVDIAETPAGESIWLFSDGSAFVKDADGLLNARTLRRKSEREAAAAIVQAEKERGGEADIVDAIRALVWDGADAAMTKLETKTEEDDMTTEQTELSATQSAAMDFIGEAEADGVLTAEQAAETRQMVEAGDIVGVSNIVMDAQIAADKAKLAAEEASDEESGRLASETEAAAISASIQRFSSDTDPAIADAIGEYMAERTPAESTAQAMAELTPAGWDGEDADCAEAMAEADEPTEFGEPAPFQPDYDSAVLEAENRRGWDTEKENANPRENRSEWVAPASDGDAEIGPSEGCAVVTCEENAADDDVLCDDHADAADGAKREQTGTEWLMEASGAADIIREADAEPTEKPEPTPEPPAPKRTRKAKAKKPCMCGCGEMCGGRFRPGHDARLKSTLHKLESGGFVETEETRIPAVAVQRAMEEGHGVKPFTAADIIRLAEAN